ncbi:MAG: permease prefix domain 1-containing protein [Solirubrobacterales bacterium]
MNKIEAYIDSIYGNFDTTDKDTKILKEEMRTHLYEEAAEFKKSGLSEDESMTKALERFGKENTVVNEMNKILRNRSIFAKMLIKAGAAVFILGCLFQILGIINDNLGLKNISYFLFIITLSICNIAFYYYYFNKKRDLVLVVFFLSDFVICLPIYLVWTYFPSHIAASLSFILGITFLITLILRIYYVKFKKI